MPPRGFDNVVIVLFCIFVLSGYVCWRLVRVCKRSDSEIINELGLVGCYVGMCLAAILTLVSIDCFINLLYNPLFMELKSMLHHG